MPGPWVLVSHPFPDRRAVRRPYSWVLGGGRASAGAPPPYTAHVVDPNLSGYNKFSGSYGTGTRINNSDPNPSVFTSKCLQIFLIFFPTYCKIPSLAQDTGSFTNDSQPLSLHKIGIRNFKKGRNIGAGRLVFVLINVCFCFILKF